MKKLSGKSLLAVLLALTLCVSMNVMPASAAKKKAKTKGKVTTVAVKAPTGSKKVAYVAKGKSIKLKAVVKAKPNKKANKKVTYKSANKKIATVSAKGVVKGKKLGKTKITMTSVKNKKKKKTITIRVTNPVKQVKLNQKKVQVGPGETIKLKATVKAPKKSFKKVQFISSNRKVATVNKKGVVKTRSTGTAKITAKAYDGSGKKAVCTVKVANGIKNITFDNPLKAYSVSKVKVTLNKAQKLNQSDFTIKTKINPDGSYNLQEKVKNIYTSDNTNYYVFLKDSSFAVGEYVQVTVNALKGRKTFEKQFTSDAREQEMLIEADVNDVIDNYVSFNDSGSRGYLSYKIESGSLPAGLTYDTKENRIQGIVRAVANNQKVTFAATDEYGKTFRTIVKFMIGDKNHIVAENKVIGDKAYNKVYPHTDASVTLHVSGGSGSYIAKMLDDCGEIFSVSSNPSDSIYIDCDPSRLTRPGTYNVKVSITDEQNPALFVMAVYTVVVSNAQQVNITLNNFKDTTDRAIRFYSYEEDETYFFYPYSENYDAQVRNIGTIKEYVPNGHYKIYSMAYGTEIVYADYYAVNGTVNLTYTLSELFTISGVIKDKNGNPYQNGCYVYIYKADEPYDDIDYDYVSSGDYDDYGGSGKYNFTGIPNGSYIVEAVDEGERIRSGVLTVNNGNVTCDLTLPIANY